MKELRAATIVQAVGDASQRWRDADLPARVRTTRGIEARTGYTEPVIDFALDALFATIDAQTIAATIASELGSLAALDGLVGRAGRPDVTYRARDPIAIVSSDTTIGVAIPALVFALCAKARVRVKDRSDGLLAAFVETLGEERRELRDAVDVGSWDGADEPDAHAFLADAGAVVAYGREATLRAIRAHLRADATFIGFGHRTSAAYVARETLSNESDAKHAALALARDVLLYDGDGCLSPHAIFVEAGGRVSPHALARLLGEACDKTAVEFPAGYREIDGATARYRDAARFRAAQGTGAVFGGALTPHLIVLDPPLDEAPPLLRRTAAVYAVNGPAEVGAFLARHALALEGLALSASRPDLEVLGVTIAARIAPLGELQRPPLAGDHGGTERILPLLRATYRA